MRQAFGITRLLDDLADLEVELLVLELLGLVVELDGVRGSRVLLVSTGGD